MRKWILFIGLFTSIVSIAQPTITQISPTSASSGSTIVITGTNLTGVTAISLGGTAVSSFQVLSSTTVTAVVGSGSTGAVSLTTAGGTTSFSGFTYIPTLPAINSMSLIICSGVSFNISPVDGINGVVPSETTYSWNVPLLTAAIVGAESKLGQTSIYGTLTNSTNVTQTAVYSVTPFKSGAGAGQPFTVTITILASANINPTGMITCSGVSFSITPINIINGQVPLNTLYTWDVPTITAAQITGGLSAVNSMNINGTLFNNTPLAQTATYTVTPNTSGCIGKNFTVTISLLPTATIQNFTRLTTSGNAFTVSPMNLINGTIPTGTLYSWNAPTYTGLVTGGQTVIDSPNITGTLNNGTGSIQTATYLVSPRSGNCIGSVFSVVVTIQSSVSSPTITSFVPTSAGAGASITIAGTNFTGVSAVTLGGTAVSSFQVLSSTTILAVVGSGSSGALSIATSGGFASLAGFTYLNTSLSVTSMTAVICSGVAFQLSPIDGVNGIIPQGTTYSWGSPQVTSNITGGQTQTGKAFIYGTLVNTSFTIQTATYTVVPYEASSGLGAAFTVTITVLPAAQIAAFSRVVCSGVGFTITPVNLINGTIPSGTFYSWGTPTTSTPSFTGNVSGSNQLSIFGTLHNNTNTPQSATYFVTPITILGLCAGVPFPVTIYVNPTADISPITLGICTGLTFFLTPENNVNGIIPSGTTYQWDLPTYNGSVSGGQAITNMSLLFGNLRNSSNSIQQAIYHVIPTTPLCGNGAAFSVVVNLSPRPIITGISTSTCSGVGFMVTPTNGIHGTVPDGTLYSWSLPSHTGSITGSQIGTDNPSSITGFLRNVSSIAQTVTYAVTPKFGNCVGNEFTVVITLNPTPEIMSISTVTCSGTSFSVSVTDQIHGIVPNGTQYSWSYPTFSGTVTGGVYGNNNPNGIYGQLSNRTNQLQTGTYAVTPNSGSCLGAPFTFTVRINPTQEIISFTNATCSGVGFSITPTNGIQGIIPVATLYTWAMPQLSSASLTGGQTGFNTTNIVGTFINNSNTTQTATYSIIPSTPNCGSSYPFTLVVSVHPKPQINPLSSIVCSGVTFTITPTNSVNGIIPNGTTYRWNMPTYTATFTGGASATGQPNVFGALRNSVNTTQTATYLVTPSIANCGDGAPFTVTVTVPPTAEISTMTTVTCSGVPFTVSPMNNSSGIVPAGSTFSWNVPAFTGTVTGGASATNNPGMVFGTLSNRTNTIQTVTYYVVPVSGFCTGSMFTLIVTLNPMPEVKPMTTVSCSGLLFTITPTNSTNGIIPPSTLYSWNTPTFTASVVGGQSGNNQSFISGTLSNLSNLGQEANYTITPRSGNCVGSAFMLTVYLNPTPVINSMSTVTCSGVLFSITPTNGTNGILPDGILYNWSAPIFTGTVTGGSSATNYPTIVTGNLLNRTNLAQTVTYVVIPQVGNCVGAAFSVIVSLQPTPEIANISQTTSSGTPFAISPANVLQGIVPFNTLYSWNLPTYSSASVTGAVSASNQANIFGTLTNSTASIQTATYSISPFAGNCSGTNFIVSISLLPTIIAPTITSFTPSSAGAGATITITGTNLNTTTAITLGGIAVASFQVLSSTSITAIVGNGASGAISITTMGGITALPGFTFLLPIPTITSFTPSSAGIGATLTITGINLIGTTIVTLGGTPVTSFQVLSSTTITAIIGNGATGSLNLTTAGGTAALSGFTFIPSPPNNVSGIISTNITWTKANSPYFVIGNTQVNSGYTLTIEPGVVVNFSANTYLKILGNIIANGTSADSIIFKSVGNEKWAGIQLISSLANINSDYTYANGSIFKYARFDNSSKALFIYNSSFYVENCNFTNNIIGFEPRSTTRSLLGSTIFKSNTTGIYSEYEDYTSGYTISCIKDLRITLNSFINNNTGANLNMNQRTFDNLQIQNNYFENNSSGLILGGGGYGPYLANVSIKKNVFNKNANGLSISTIYGNGYNGCSGAISFPLIIENNIITASSSSGISFNFSSSDHTIRNNIISNNEIGLSISGTTSRLSFFNNNLVENKKSVQLNGGAFYEPSNIIFSKNYFKYNGPNNTDYIILNNVTNNSNRAVANNFDLLSSTYLIKNTNRGNYTFDSNQVVFPPSTSNINDIIYDINNDVSYGEVKITNFNNIDLASTPIGSVKNLKKSFTNNQVTLSWTNNSVSDHAGSKIYFGGYTGFSYSNVIDAGKDSSYTLPIGVGINEDIAVTNYDESANGIDDQFDGNESWYSIATVASSALTPTITTFTPTSAGKGATLTITGINLIGTTIVTLGGTPVTSFQVLSSTTITAIIGNGATGSLNLTTAGGTAALSGFTFIPSPPNNVSGIISTNITWTKANSPYFVVGNTQLNNGYTLTIEPGVIVYFSANTYLKVLGTIIAQGSISDSIIFKSAANEKWSGIQLISSASNVESDYSHTGGSIFKYVKFDNASRSLFIYNSSFYVENCYFSNNTIGFEPRSTTRGLLASSTFQSNTTGIYTEYEDYISGYNVNCIKDLRIVFNSFIDNSTGANLNLNQRTFDSLQIFNNQFYTNLNGLILGGGGYGPYLANVSIKKNIFYKNLNGLSVSTIYGNGYNGCSGTMSFPLIIEKNTIVSNDSLGISFNFSGSNHIIRNNIVSNNKIGISVSGTTSNVGFYNNNIIDNRKSVLLNGGQYYEPNNILLRYNYFKSSGFNTSDYIITNNVTNNTNRAVGNNFDIISSILLVRNINRGEFSLDSNRIVLPSGINNIKDVIYDINNDVSYGEVKITNSNILDLTVPPIGSVKNLKKTLKNGQVKLTWENNTVNDFSGSKVYFGNYTGFSYSNTINASTDSSYILPSGVNIDENIAVTNYDASVDGIDDQHEGNESWFTISVPIPSINSINLISCSGEGFMITPVNGVNGLVPTGTTFSWSSPTFTASVTGVESKSGQNSIFGKITNQTNVIQTITYTVLPKSNYGNGDVFTVTITLYPISIINPLSSVTCSGITFTNSPTNAYNGIIPSETLYSWSPPQLSAGLTGAASLSNQTSISGTLFNTTNTVQTAVYSVIPKNYDLCNGTPFTVTIFVQPVASIKALTTITCSGVSFTITPTHINNGIIPQGTLYTWSEPQISSTSVTGGQSGFNKLNIEGTFNNNTNTTQTATFIVTPSTPNCGTGAPFTITVTVHPTAKINTLTTITCSGVTFTITPTHGLSGIIPQGTLYSWMVPQISTPSLTGGQTGFNRTNITGLIINNTNTTQTVTYVVTPISTLCGVSNSFSVIVTVYPNAQISPLRVTVCSGVLFRITPTNNLDGIIPNGTTYRWNMPTYTATITGGTSAAGQSNVFGWLRNTVNTTQTATYIVTPSIANCGDGTPFLVTASILPIAEINAINTVTCSGVQFTITPTNGTNGIVPQFTTYTWTVPTYSGMVTGGASATNSVTIVSGLLNNRTNTTQTATFIVTPSTPSGCVGTFFTVTVTLPPTAEISSITTVTCSGVPFVITPTNGTTGIVPNGILYSWNAPTFTGTVTGGASATNYPTIIAGNLLNRTNLVQTATYVVTPRVGNCVGAAFSVIVSLQPTPEIVSIAQTTNSGTPFVISPANGLQGIVPFNTRYSWNLPTYSSASVTGALSASNQANIFGTLTNATNSIQTSIYTINPIAGNCTGANFTVSISLLTTIFTPTITSFSPSSAGTGATITILGTNLENTVAISLGGISVASFQVLSSTTIAAVVGAGASGAVSVTTAGGSAALSGFNFIYPTPTILSFAPASGPVGTLVTITGTNLNNPTAINIGGVTAIPVSFSENTVVAMIMPGATKGAVRITTSGGTANGNIEFSVINNSVPAIQQGTKLVGTGSVGNAYQGDRVALSADGNTAIVGGSYDDGFKGAAWIYTRSGSTWTQQGNKLVGSGSAGTSFQGSGVALSADGNTAIIGGYADDNNKGAVWIFTRNGTSWVQQGPKLVGSGAAGSAQQGYSVSLSADGNTAMIGGWADSSNIGAVWIFNRNGNTWSQMGNKLVGSGAVGNPQQGFSVALSADGKTAIIGGNGDNSNIGAAWVFTRSSNSWTQQGSKLVGADVVGNPFLGMSVAVSADGNTTILGGFKDSTQGAAWVFTRTGNSWSQQGRKLVATGSLGYTEQGIGVAVSADGNTAIIGDRIDISEQGGAWIYSRNGDTWTQRGSKISGIGGVGSQKQGSGVAISSDGNTAIIGGPGDDNNKGAAWIFIPAPTPSPVITSFTPTAAGTGNVITIIGTNLTGTTAITLGGIQVASFQVLSSTTINAVVGSGATGALSLINTNGTATLPGFVYISNAPSINSLSTATCSGTNFTLTPVNGINGTIPSGTTYSWSVPQLSAGLTGALSGINQTAISGTLFNATNTTQTAIYIVTPNHPSSGNGAPFTITVTVHPTAIINSLTTVTCGGVTFTITPTHGLSGIIPQGTLYSWMVPQISTPSLTGGQTGFNRTNITGLIINNTNTTQTVTYVVTPITTLCGVSNSFSVIVTVYPIAQISPLSVTVCSGNTFTLTPTNFTNGIVPVATRYTWSVPIYSGSLFGGNSKTDVTAITGTLLNSSSVTQTATYFVSPRSGSCVGPVFTVTASINPTPEVSAFSITGCRRVTFTAAPVNGNIPSTTLYSWAAPTFSASMVGGLSGSNRPYLVDTLANVSNLPQEAYYSLTPKAGNCVGANFTLTVYISPEAVINAISIVTCSGVPFVVSPTNGSDGIVPLDIRYKWDIPSFTGTITGGEPNNGPSNIFGTLRNTTDTTQTATYIVTPFVSTCGLGDPFTVTITLLPAAEINSMSTVTCSGVPFVVTPTNGTNGIVPDGILYSWSAPIFTGTVIGGVSATNSPTIVMGNLLNRTNLAQTATYVVTPRVGNCVGAAFSVIVSLQPTPEIISFVKSSNSGAGFAITPANDSQGIVPINTLYSWSIPTITSASVTGAQNGNNQSTIFGTLNNPSNAIQTATYLISPLASNCIGASFTVTVSVKPTFQIISFAPSSAGTGATVTIRGKGFTNINQISFGGSIASSFTILSDTAATAIVGSGASGFVKITSPLSVDSLSGFTFGLPIIRLYRADSTLVFGAEKGKYSRALNYSVSANFLQNPLQIVAPDNFQVSRFQDSAYSSSLSINHQNGTIDSTKIFVRFKLDTLGSFTGSVVHTSLAATTRSITVTGSSQCDSVVYITPIVNNILADTIICFKDSLVLSTTSGTFNNYLWSTGDTTKNLVVKSSGSYSLQVGSGKGCLSNVSRIIKTNKNTNPIPSLALIGNKTLISSIAPKYRWLVNNTLIPGNNTNSLVPSKVGFYAVETTNDSICWDRSTDYPIFVLSNPLVNDTLAIKLYPNPTSTGTFFVVATLQRSTNVVARVTVADGNGNVLLQTNKFIFFGREVKIPITLAVKGTVFVRIDVNGDVKTQTVILQ